MICWPAGRGWWASATPTRMPSICRMGPIKRVVFPYEYLFRCVNTHLLLDEALTGDVEYDKYLIYSALEQGRGWVGYDLLGSTKGFSFKARSASEHAIAGRRTAPGRAP